MKTFEPFLNKPFTDYLLYALTYEYEQFDNRCLEILEKAAYMLENLLSVSMNAAMRILCEYDMSRVLAILIEKYFIKAESPLGIQSLLDKSDRQQL